MDFGQLWPLIQTTMCIFHITEVVLQKINGTKLTPLGLGVRELKQSATAGNIKGYFNEMTIDSNDDVIITAHGQALVAQIVTLE